MIIVGEGVLDPFSAQKMLFRPGIYEKYKDDPDLYRLLNLGEELETVIFHMSAEAVERSVGEIKDLCYRILSDAPKVSCTRVEPNRLTAINFRIFRRDFTRKVNTLLRKIPPKSIKN